MFPVDDLGLLWRNDEGEGGGGLVPISHCLEPTSGEMASRTIAVDEMSVKTCRATGGYRLTHFLPLPSLHRYPQQQVPTALHRRHLP
jgi:hypothetical protein